MSLTWISLSTLPSNAPSVHQCHPQKLSLSPQPPPNAVTWDLCAVTWCDLGTCHRSWASREEVRPSPPAGFPFLGSGSPQKAPSETRTLNWSLDDVFSPADIRGVFCCVRFHFLGIPTGRNALSVCAQSFSSWLEGNCCSPDYVPILANCTAEVPHKILCFHGDLPSTFPKRTH